MATQRERGGFEVQRARAAVREQRKCAGCEIVFVPAPGEEFHSPSCEERAWRRGRKGRPHTNPAFWYEVLDVIHFFYLSMQQMYPGMATVHRKDWIRIFYDGTETKPALRAWERFKQRARDRGLVVVKGEAETAAGFLHLDINLSYDGAFDALGAPHPGGLEAEAAALERQKLAAALEQVAAEHTRAEGEPPARVNSTDPTT